MMSLHTCTLVGLLVMDSGSTMIASVEHSAALMFVYRLVCSWTLLQWRVQEVHSEATKVA